MTGRTSIGTDLLVRGFGVAVVPGIAPTLGPPAVAPPPVEGVPHDVSMVVLGGVALLAVVGLTNFLYRYGLRLVGALRSFAGESSADRTSESGATTATAASPPDRPLAEGDPNPDASPPLTDEEQVLQLLEENDGQLPQSEIVARTPWSKSKVSRLLARMDVQDQIVKLNAGRRNVILLPEAEPPEVKPSGDRESETH